MTQRRAGFTVEEIECMDARQQWFVYERQVEREKFQKLENQLLIAEAINYAYLASQPPAKKGQSNPHFREYKKWRKRKLNMMYPEQAKNQPTVWDFFKRRSIKIM